MNSVLSVDSCKKNPRMPRASNGTSLKCRGSRGGKPQLPALKFRTQSLLFPRQSTLSPRPFLPLDTRHFLLLHLDRQTTGA